MDLILWRHAEAEDAGKEANDMKRCLTKRGERHAARMAKWLDRQLHERVKIFCSPADRCIQTVQPLGRKFKIKDELSIHYDHSDLLTLSQWPNAKSTVLIVGHQPTLGFAIGQALGIREISFSIKRGSVWWLRSSDSGEEYHANLVTIQSPELL